MFLITDTIPGSTNIICRTNRRYQACSHKRIIQINIATLAIAIARALIIRIRVFTSKDTSDIRVFTICGPEGH